MLPNSLLHVHDLMPEMRALNECTIRGLCSAAYLGDDTALCRSLGRYKLFVDTRDVGLSSHLLLDGYWEMWNTEVMASVIRPGMVVADVGANVGYFTVLMAELVGPAGRVHAFEPNVRLASRLSNSLSINGFAGWTEVHQVALADTDGEVILVTAPDEPKNAYTIPPQEEMPEHGVTVPMARLDSRPDWAQIEFAKIDVEGAEQILWQGMDGLLEGGALKTVLLEFNAHRYSDPVRFLDAILAAGFSLAYVDLRKGVKSCNREWVLNPSSREDVMLYLTR